MTEGPRCHKCMWFDPMNGGSVTGICRLVPPTVIPTQMNNPDDREQRTTKPFTTWPIVRRDDWCGKYAKGD